MTDIPVDGKVPRVGQNLLGWENRLLQKPGSRMVKNEAERGNPREVADLPQKLKTNQQQMQVLPCMTQSERQSELTRG